MKAGTDSVEAQAIASQYTREEEYWLSKLAGVPVKSGFPYDTPAAPDHDDFKNDLLEFKFSGDISWQLMRLSNGSDLRLHIIFTALVNLLLARYTGTTDIIVGAPIPKQDIDGLFINTLLILRNHFHESMTFKELLLQVGQCVTEAVENVNYPLEILLYKLNMPFTHKDFPLFDIVVLVENIHDKRHIRQVFPNMIFSFGRSGETVSGELEYNTRRYTRKTIECIVRHFTRAMTSALGQPDLPLQKLDILSPQEKEQLITGFNQSQCPYPAHKSLHQLFAEQVERTPDHAALLGGKEGLFDEFGAPGLSSDFDAVHLSYRELAEKSRQLAQALRDKSVRPDTIVAIMVGRCVEMIIGILGILKAGGAYLPIDPGYPQERIHYMLNDSGTRILVTNGTLAGEGLEVGKWEGDMIPPDTGNRTDNSAETPYVEPGPTPVTALAYIIYTSGSTGQPRGVMIEQPSVVNLVTWYAGTFNLDIGTHVALLANYTFDASVEDIFSSLTYGSTLFIPPKEVVLDKNKFVRYMNEHRVNVINFVPAALEVLLTGNKKPGSLQGVISGGEKLGNRLKDLLIGKGYCLYNSYGPTEMTVDALLEKCSAKKVSLGKPIANIRAYILGKGQLSLQPVGVAGELCLSGAGMARGYLNQVELTKEKFIGHPFIPRERLYRTGDLVRRLPEGSIEFLDRIDNQVKIRGFRIELGEIENRLYTWKQVKEAVVLARENKNGEKKLCAYIVPLNKPSFSLTGLKEYLARQLPDYMIPTNFVYLDRIPLTPNGKVDRNVLPEPEVNPEVKYIAPKNQVEKKLVEIWSEVLGIKREMISVEANFFNLGGHSLKAGVMIARIQKELKVRLPLANVFKTPTVKALSRCIKGLKKTEYVSISPVEKKEYYRLSSAQERLYVLHRLDEQNIDANISYISILEGNLGKNRFAEVFRLLIKRHESLRTSFHLVGNQAVQRVHQEVEFAIEYYDGQETTQGKYYLETIDGNTPLPLEIKKIIKNFVRPFYFSYPPLLRVGLIKVKTSRFLLMIDIHHIIADGFSQRLLLEDFMRHYAGEDLSPLKLQYKEYSQWWHRLYQSESIKEQESYWLKELDGELPVLSLPFDFDFSNMRSFEGSSLVFEICPGDTKALREILLEEGVTLAAALMAIYYVLLAKYSGQEDIIIGIAAAGRTHVDLQNIVGMFVNMLPARNRPLENKTFATFLKAVNENLLNAYENQDYPYDELIKKLKLQRIPGRDPLLNAVFTLQNYLDENGNEDIITLGDLKLIPYPYEHSGNPNFLLDLEPFERNDHIQMNLGYLSGLFEKSTARDITQHYLEILKQVLENRNIRLKDIKISYQLSASKRDILQEDNTDFAF